ncbi:1425_t:CDS:2, partial [Rhizophagus irregularis]
GEVENGNNPQANGGAGDSKKTKELQDVYNDLSPETRTYCNGCLSDTLKSAFELVDKQAEITIEILDHMKRQEARLSELESQKVRMDRIEARLYQLECKMNKVDFLSDSRDWVGMFMTNLAGKYGERELFDAETVLEKEMDLTDHEIKSIQKALKRLNDLLPNDVDKYKTPLQRTLKKIDTWHGTWHAAKSLMLIN